MASTYLFLAMLLGAASSPDLERDFRQPPDAARPWAYWWWLNGNVTEESITRDLEAMKQQGFGGVLMFDARGYHDTYVPPPPSRMDFMSPEWRKHLHFAMTEANRLGLTMSMNLSSCAGTLKGPWDVGDEAPKRLIWTSAVVQGPRRIEVALPQKQPQRFWNGAIVAAKQTDAGAGPAASDDKAAFSDKWEDAQIKSEGKSLVREVVDLTDKVDPQGRLVWDVPDGTWTLLRFAYEVMSGYENDVDVLNPHAVESYFTRMGETIRQDAGPLVGKTFTHFYSVSWEGAVPTWTSGFEQEFEKYRGYSLRPYLPVLAGMTVISDEVTQRFVRDYARSLSDCFLNNCYGKLRDLCHNAGLQIHCESGGPWDRGKLLFTHADQFAFLSRNDMPQAEFWHPWKKDRPQSNARRIAMTAHIYGKPLASTEAFTHMTLHWSAYPAVLKPAADAVFCDGINAFVWHTFTASPEEFGKPGIEYFAGTHLNPNVTWWEQSRAFLRYLARCQYLLRQGQFVADVCCYTSDRNYERWGRSEKWSEKPSLVLPRGFAYDLVNTEVLLDRMSVKDGRLVLPDGMSYSLLVVDLEEDAVVPEVLKKIHELIEQGATIVFGKRRPDKSLGLANYPASDQEVRQLAAELWGGESASASGRGRKIIAGNLEETLHAEKIEPDFVGPWDYIHRRSDDADIYYVSGSGREECRFRVAGKEPELWNPVTGESQDAVCYRSETDGYTTVPITLPNNGSVFVVFRKAAAAPHVFSFQASPGTVELLGRKDERMLARLWKAGRYEFVTGTDQKKLLEIESLPEPVTLTKPWEVRFAKGWGAPETAIFERLVPWNEHSDEGIKYYSGKATYRTTFSLDDRQASQAVRLDLGTVKHVAQVRINGTDLGIVWTDPWAVNATGAVRTGENQLEIDVVNLWVNRLVGDARLPVEKRFTRTNVPLDAKTPGYRGYNADVPLEPSGLLGPVRLLFGADRELRLD